jgi:prepilin-type N-terminal cleavage/methylation domain-containing protein
MISQNNQRSDRAFSIIELLIVIVIIGAISTTAVPYGQLAYIRQLEEQLDLNLEDIRTAIKRWRTDCEAHIVREYGVEGILEIPEPFLYPPDIGSLANNTPHSFVWGIYNVTFYHIPYLSRIPPDPFVGRPAWTQHYAMGDPAKTTTFDIAQSPTVSEDNPPAPPLPPPLLGARLGVFNVSPVANSTERRGFLRAIDGSLYSDW